MNHKNFAQTILAAAITDTAATSITVASSTTFPATPFIISIDTEAILVTVVAGTTWTVTRGYEGSTAATHTNGVTIYHDISAAEADKIAAISVAGAELINDADAAAQRATLGAVATGDSRLSDARVASDVSAWAKSGTKPAYAASEIINISAAGQALIDDANAAAQIATLGITATAAELNALDGATGAWTSFTPTITAGAGTFTTKSCQGYWIQIGKTVTLSFAITITTNGTAAVCIIMTLPVTPKRYGGGFICAREDITHKAVMGEIVASGSLITLYSYDGTYPGATSYVIVGGGSYEAA